MNITFQGAAAKLSYSFSCVVCQVLARFCFYFLMSTSQNYTKTIIRLRLSKYWPIIVKYTVPNRAHKPVILRARRLEVEVWLSVAVNEPIQSSLISEIRPS